MKHDFIDLLVKADFSRESGLYEKLCSKLFLNTQRNSLAERRINENALENLAAAGDSWQLHKTVDDLKETKK